VEISWVDASIVAILELAVQWLSMAYMLKRKVEKDIVSLLFQLNKSQPSVFPTFMHVNLYIIYPTERPILDPLNTREVNIFIALLRKHHKSSTIVALFL